jgi:hypothetical protein
MLFDDRIYRKFWARQVVFLSMMFIPGIIMHCAPPPL